MKKLLGLLVVGLSLSGVACSRVEIDKAITVTDVFSGWHYAGVAEGDLNRMVPSFSFRLNNVSDETVSRVQLLVSFWPEGADGEIDSKQITGIGPEGLAAKASTDPILVRAENGYTLPLSQAREEMFMHSLFRDFTVKVFARSEGTLVSLGEFKVDRRIIPSAPSTAVPQAPAAPTAP
jgi:hypothetical protein